ncbi:MAG: BlaI/MecI/CopY family transcriptional regulator [Lachnospiraceae bacterium]|nr:BlaI/MecI/CopY family transcriptional regulator [Lachnospiraceae bacterium]
MRRLPESELEIMMIVWNSSEAVSVNRILEQMTKDKDLTLGALHSYLKRLVNKGFLITRKRGKQNVYEALITQTEYQEMESRTILKQLYNGSLKTFVATLYNSDQITREDVDELRSFIDSFSDKSED